MTLRRTGPAGTGSSVGATTSFWTSASSPPDPLAGCSPPARIPRRLLAAATAGLAALAVS